ncbi:hypothetical protein GNP84_06600 [Aliivibrio fischeri]|uniref:hypothetical protein n=1 Tax=Aliivibrio fischeri TaxID=668 RepID=UPI0012D90422|nr:hypothetical protein [Aliivibrio fischeri]MUK76575.1 hypothetical protein [Aliivibrio fischeri]
MFSVFFDIIVPFIMMLSIGSFIYLIHSFPSSLSKRHHRYQKTGAIGLALFYLVVFDLTEFNVLFYDALIGFLLLYFFYGFSVKPLSSPYFVIEPSLHDKHRVQLHLASLTLPLGKAVYNDLFLVLDELQLEGIRTVVLTSPLFIKQSERRNVLYFKRALTLRSITLDDKPISYWRKLWSCCLLGYQKYINHAPSLVSLSLTHWHQYTLHLPPITQVHHYQNDNEGA